MRRETQVLSDIFRPLRLVSFFVRIAYRTQRTSDVIYGYMPSSTAIELLRIPAFHPKTKAIKNRSQTPPAFGKSVDRFYSGD
jgi:hypothetical protein